MLCFPFIVDVMTTFTRFDNYASGDILMWLMSIIKIIDDKCNKHKLIQKNVMRGHISTYDVINIKYSEKCCNHFVCFNKKSSHKIIRIWSTILKNKITHHIYVREWQNLHAWKDILDLGCYFTMKYKMFINFTRFDFIFSSFMRWE